jgi:hypothetical protein
MQIQRTIRKTKNRAGKTVYHARLRWRVDASGKWHEVLRKADNASHAQKRLDKLATEIEEKDPVQLQAGKVTFRQLVQHAKDTHYVPAVYDEHGSKVKGVRGITQAHHQLDKLVQFFGNKDIRKINFELLLEYKVARRTLHNSVYSHFSAVIGSTLIALRAGTRHARVAAIISKVGTTINVYGSV